MYHHPMGGFGPGSFFFPFDGLLAVLLIVAIVLIVWLIATRGSRGGAGRPLDDADAILRTRLAKGEITPEEYEQTRKTLGLK